MKNRCEICGHIVENVYDRDVRGTIKVKYPRRRYAEKLKACHKCLEAIVGFIMKMQNIGTENKQLVDHILKEIE